MSQKLTLTFFGAALTVTGSKLRIQYQDHAFLFDCGLFQGPKALRQRNWDSHSQIGPIEAVILSHAHIDHSGYLPRFVKDGFSGPIYCTEATRDLCRVLLMDAAYLQEEDARFANSTKYTAHHPALPLFDQRDAERTLPMLTPRSYHDWHPLCPGLSFRFLRAGHILGSAITQIAIEKNNHSEVLTLTGDLGNGRSCILEDPETVPETDYLVMESTYGDRRQSRSDSQVELATIINRVVGRGGTLIIPAFSVGRTQEVLYLVSLLHEQGKIGNYPVYLDSPMANSATRIYRNYPEELKTDVRGDHLESCLSRIQFFETKTTDESMLLCMSTEPKIIVSAAGMLTGGRVMHHLKCKLPDEKSGVLFVGYQAQGTKGLLLKNGLGDIRIHHQKVRVEAEIMSLDSLSAHADSENLLHFVRQMREKPRRIFLHHGEINALETLANTIQTELKIETIIAQEQVKYEV